MTYKCRKEYESQGCYEKIDNATKLAHADRKCTVGQKGIQGS